MPREHIETVWAESGLIIDPGPTKIDDGWLAEKPAFQHQNWQQNRADEMLQWIEQHGIQDWSALTTYPDTGLCLGTDGVIYQSQQAANTNHQPVGDGGTWWEEVNFKASLVAAGGYIQLQAEVPFIIQWGTTNVLAETILEHTLPLEYPTVHAVAYGQEHVISTSAVANVGASGWPHPVATIDLTNGTTSAADIGWISMGW